LAAQPFSNTMSGIASADTSASRLVEPVFDCRPVVSYASIDSWEGIAHG
jgi:hypothetical protein